MSAPLEALRAVLEADGGLLADALRPVDLVAASDGALGAVAASGPRAQGDAAGYALVVEAIREGYLLHYGVPRVLAGDDPDFALLAGDRLYALGLDRLAAIGDLAAVAALAEVIALAAQAHAADDPDLAEAVWAAGVAQVGWGDDASLRAARTAARSGDPSAVHALRAAAGAVLEVGALPD